MFRNKKIIKSLQISENDRRFKNVLKKSGK